MPRQLVDLGGNGVKLIRTCCVDCLDQVVEVETDVMGVDVSQAVDRMVDMFTGDQWPGVPGHLGG